MNQISSNITILDNTVRPSQKRIHVKICISIHTSNHTQRNVHLVHSFGLFHYALLTWILLLQVNVFQVGI